MPSWVSVSGISPSIPWRQRAASLLWWWPIFVSGAIIFGGIYGGVFTPTEASAVAAMLLFVLYIYRSLIRKAELKFSKKFSELYEMLTDTALTSAMIFFIFGSATIFSNFMVLTGLTIKFSDFVIGLGLPPLGIVILFCVVYLVLGCFLDSISMLCMTVALFNPIVEKAGVDPIWYAVIVILAIEIGFITPPFGINLFAVMGVAERDVDMKDIIVGSSPFLIAELISLVIFFSFPILATYLPAFVG
jgi:tripartite ATP-independent transporter DctM subunit